MTSVKRACVLGLLAGACLAQSQAPATTDQLQYFRFMLMNLASLDHSPSAVTAFGNHLAPQFGLNSQESAQIQSAAQQLATLLLQIRASAATITAGKTVLSDADAASLAALSSQREQLITTLANQILNSVRPETAARLRMPGQIVAAATAKGQAAQ